MLQLVELQKKLLEAAFDGQTAELKQLLESGKSLLKDGVRTPLGAVDTQSHDVPCCSSSLTMHACMEVAAIRGM